jgi:hypothetical protein
VQEREKLGNIKTMSKIRECKGMKIGGREKATLEHIAKLEISVGSSGSKT